MARIDVLSNNDVLLKNFQIAGQEISNIDVYFPRKGKWQIFLVAESKNGLTEIIEFVDVGNYFYRASLDYPIRIKDEQICGKLLCIDCETHTHFYTGTFHAVLIADKFELARQTYLVKEFGSKIEGYYKCIVQLMEQLFKEKGEKE